MDPFTQTIVAGLISQASGFILDVAKQYTLQRLGLASSSSAPSDIKPLLDDYLQQLKGRLDEDRIATLSGAFSTLKDASRTTVKRELLAGTLAKFHEVSQIPQQGITGGYPNAQLRCMAFVGMVASYTMLQVQPELIAEKMVEAVQADVNTAKRWLGESLVKEIVTRLGTICPKCGFRNTFGARFCNQDGYPLLTDQADRTKKMGELTGVVVQRFGPVWYIPAKDLWSVVVFGIGDKDQGVLIVRDNLLEFQGEKKNVYITHIQEVSLLRNPPSIKVIHSDSSTPSPAYFADTGGLGYRGILGGNKLIVETLLKTYLSR